MLSVCLTPGNTDDREPVPDLMEGITGMAYGDKGYVAQWLQELLAEKNIRFVARPRKNMKNVELTLFDKVALRHRAVIESIYDQLKNISQIEHTHHRSVYNFGVNLIAGLIAYTKQEHKPSFDVDTMSQLPVTA